MRVYSRKADVIIRNGTILDGTGLPRYYADVAIRGEKIDYIGDLSKASAPLEIDAAGKLVTPGFVDPHAHSDFTVWVDPLCQSAVRQGVTTEIVGNCGFSARCKVDADSFHPDCRDIRSVYNYPGDPAPGRMAAVLDQFDALRPAQNYAWLCGHNSLRLLAGVTAEDYTPAQFTTMERLLREAMEAGFFGFSTGLEFNPGILSRPEEVERLAAIAAEYDANYSTHMRDEGTYILEAVEEFLNVIRKTGMRGTVSHLNVKYDNGVPNEYLQKAMQLLKDARAKEHLNVFADMLPTCSATGAALAILPPWLYADGWDAARARLGDPEVRAKLRTDCNRYWRFLQAGQWDRLLYVQPDYMPEVCSIPFAELQKLWHKDGFDCFFDIMQAAPTLAAATNCCMQGQVFHEQTMIESVIKDPIYMWQTDSSVTVEEGPFVEPNWQHYMSMTYFFTHYIRDLGCMSMEQALPKATSIPARHFQLRGRGIIAEGNYADINVFALEDLKVNAELAHPCRYSSGMWYVLVNGQPVIAHGEHTGARPGRALRHNRD